MNKKVLITGGAKGLGKSIALVFAKNKYDVILTYLNSEKEAHELCTYINENYGVNAECLKMNIREEKDIDYVASKLDRLDCLINNAAYNNDCDLFEHAKNEFMKILDTNLIGPFMLTKNVYHLLKKNNGSIINITSKNGIDTFYPESIDYDASKAGLINLTKNLALAFAPNVRVNAIAPGWINTHNTLDMSDDFKTHELSKILLKRFAEPEEIAELVYFVADKGTYINGSIIDCDGGVK